MVRQAIIGPHPAKFHFTPAIKTEQFIFLAGLAGHEDPDTGEEIKGIEAQTRVCLNIIEDTLEATGSSLEDIVTTTVYLKNADDFLKMNEVWKEYFPNNPPARATILTGLLWPAMLIEIQCIACCSSGK